MQIIDRDFKEIFTSEIISVLGGLVAGVLLALYVQKLFIIPSLIVILPGFLEMRGNISGSFASRLSSGLFLHVINPLKYSTRIVKGNIVASFILAIIVSLALGFMAFLFTYFVFGVFLVSIIFIPLIAGIIANAIEIAITLFATFYLFRKGHDPNNIIGPFITTTGDITSIVSLLVVVVVMI